MKKNTDSNVSIPKFERNEFYLHLIGDSSLITHAWSDRAKKEMLDKQMKKATKGKKAKDPFEDFCDSLYWLSDRPKEPTMEDIQKAKFKFPTSAFKLSAVQGGYLSGITSKKTTGKAAFYIVGDFVEIIGTPTIREDMVRIGKGVADIRYRAEFEQWRTTLKIRYSENMMSMEQVINLFNAGGFGVGVGDWRPEKSGYHGTYHVATESELDEFKR